MNKPTFFVQETYEIVGMSAYEVWEQFDHVYSIEETRKGYLVTFRRPVHRDHLTTWKTSNIKEE